MKFLASAWRAQKYRSPAVENPMTDGVIWKSLLTFFFPLLMGTLFQQLYNTVDAIIVGRFVGKEALAAVGGGALLQRHEGGTRSQHAGHAREEAHVSWHYHRHDGLGSNAVALEVSINLARLLVELGIGKGAILA